MADDDMDDADDMRRRRSLRRVRTWYDAAMAAVVLEGNFFRITEAGDMRTTEADDERVVE